MALLASTTLTKARPPRPPRRWLHDEVAVVAEVDVGVEVGAVVAAELGLRVMVMAMSPVLDWTWYLLT
jgi:hypothetical protein